MVDIQGATLKSYTAYLAERTASSDGISMLPGLNGAGSAVVSTPTKFIDARDYGLSSAASAATNTTAITTALAAASTAQASLFLPGGDFNLNKIQIDYAVLASQVSIFSNPGRACRLIKSSADGEGLIQIGDTDSAGYIARLRFSNIEFRGYAGNSPFIMQTYDIARCMFDFCQFIGSNGAGIKMNGGIGNKFYGCQFQSNLIGADIDSYVGYAGEPNINTFDGCQFVDNTQWGLDFDNGRMLIVTNSDIEGNGTNGDNTTGGLRIGANVGSFDALEGQGLIARGNWFEANAGRAALSFASGINVWEDCNFIANTNATYDSYGAGGRYYAVRNKYVNNKTNNHFDEAAIGTGNALVHNTFTGGKTIDAAKTQIIDHTVMTTPVIRGMSGGVAIKNSTDVFLANIFNNSGNSWLELSRQSGAALIGVASSLSDADLQLAPLGNGLVRITNPRIVSKAAPASAAATGVQGEVRWDASYVYICTATDTWKRVAIATW
jgi:hypothetical protein